MRKIYLLLIILIASTSSFAQNPSLQNKLYYTCKVWGFVKYYHSNVSICNVNWDSVLIHTLPLVKNAVTNNDFNDALDTMLFAAGPMAIATSPLPDTIPAALKHNRNWGWINDQIFRNDVQTILDTIRNNFRPHNICWVQWANFALHPTSLDYPFLNVDTYNNYPDEFHRVMSICKYWNYMNYFNPYNYVLDKPTDTILFNNVLYIDSASNDSEFYVGVKKITSSFEDLHIEESTYSPNITYPNEYIPQFTLQYIENNYVVVKSSLPQVPVGYHIVSVDGKTIPQLEDSLINYASVGNMAVFRRIMSWYLLLQGKINTTINLTIADTFGNITNTTVTRTSLWGNETYYPADSLYHIQFCKMGCGLGYINIGNLVYNNAQAAYDSLKNSPAIIIDMRNYPASSAQLVLENLMFPQDITVVKYTSPDTLYPGTFRNNYEDIGTDNNPTAYQGTLILLFNERTQSAGETACMYFGAMPHVIKIGSQTAGTDGVISFLSVSQDIHTAYTNLGWYYPNGDSMERIGIVPDIVCKPTVAGIMQDRDEVLEKAIQVGCQVAAVQQISSNAVLKVYPNPATESININAGELLTNQATIQLSDITGRVLTNIQAPVQNGSLQTKISLQNISQGIYILKIISGTKSYTQKITKL